MSADEVKEIRCLNEKDTMAGVFENECKESYLNWYGFHGVYTASYDRDRGLRSYWSYCRAGTAKAQSGSLKLMT